jgi:hypothetical protein
VSPEVLAWQVAYLEAALEGAASLSLHSLREGRGAEEDGGGSGGPQPWQGGGEADAAELPPLDTDALGLARSM